MVYGTIPSTGSLAAHHIQSAACVPDRSAVRVTWSPPEGQITGIGGTCAIGPAEGSVPAAQHYVVGPETVYVPDRTTIPSAYPTSASAMRAHNVRVDQGLRANGFAGPVNTAEQVPGLVGKTCGNYNDGREAVPSQAPVGYPAYQPSPVIYPGQPQLSSTARGTDQPQGDPPPPPPPSSQPTLTQPPVSVGSPGSGTANVTDCNSKRSMTNVGVKLANYDGSTCVETFLAQIRNYAKYLGWDTEDQLFHMKACLTGPAARILWDRNFLPTLEELQQLLRSRFGNVNQTERYRTELRTRRRREGETLQELYNEICRLMTLAFPGPSSEAMSIMGREAFLDALNNPHFRVRVLEKGPKDMEEALSIACNLEALDRSAEVETQANLERQGQGRKDKHIRTVVETGPTQSVQTNGNNGPHDEVMKQLQKSLDRCCSDLAQVKRDVAGFKQGNRQSSMQPNNQTPVTRPVGLGYGPQYSGAAYYDPNYQYGAHDSVTTQMAYQAEPTPTVTGPSESYQPPTSGRTGTNQYAGATSTARRGYSQQRRGGGRGRYGPCLNCGQTGHWARDCTLRATGSEPTQTPTATESAEQRRVQMVSETRNTKDTYLPITVFGRKTVALLDTGCDHSIIGSRLLPKGTQMEGSQTTLLAANGTKIPLMGRFDLKFKVAGRSFSTQVVVTEVIDEIILGIDFLTAKQCQWDFGGGRILLGNSWVRLQKRETGDKSSPHLRGGLPPCSTRCSDKYTRVSDLAKTAIRKRRLGFRTQVFG